jgi:hypothetical protein
VEPGREGENFLSEVQNESKKICFFFITFENTYFEPVKSMVSASGEWFFNSHEIKSVLPVPVKFSRRLAPFFSQNESSPETAPLTFLPLFPRCVIFMSKNS